MTLRRLLPTCLCLLLLSGLASPAAAQDAAPAVAAPALVQTARFDALALHPTREVSAVVVARNDSRITAEVAASVRRWGPDNGARVARGDLLVELDPTDLRLARDRARAALDAAQAREALAGQQLQRARELVAQNFLSNEALAARDTEAVLAAADRRSAQIALASSERALAKTRIMAPFDASVRQRLVQAGEVVAPGAPLYLLAELAGAELSAQLAPEDARSLQQAKSMHFVGPDGNRRALDLLRVGATLSAPGRTLEVRLGAPGLVPGADGRLVWRDPRPHVPAALLVRRDGGLGVFTLAEGKARFVALPAAQEGRAALAELAAATLIVSQGHQGLRDGQALAP